MKTQLTVDQLAHTFSSDVIDHIKLWMKHNHADDMDFHRYRMRLLSSLCEGETTSDRLIMLIEKIPTKIKFDLMEAISDKVMGEMMARYLFSKLMLSLNEEYQKIVEHEVDRVKSENNILLERLSGYKVKIGHH